MTATPDRADDAHVVWLVDDNLVGKAPRGRLRIAVGEGERTVSLGDIGWGAVAADDVRGQGGLLEEVRVNRERYLEGTSKGPIRWIDTGWALASWRLGADRAGVVLGAAVAQASRLERAPSV